MVHFIKKKQQVKAVNACLQQSRFILLLLRKGEVQLRMNGDTILAQAGELLIVPEDRSCIIKGLGFRAHIGILGFTRAFAFENMMKSSQQGLFIFLMAKKLPILKLKHEDVSLLFLLLRLLHAIQKKARSPGPGLQSLQLGFHLLLWELTHFYYGQDSTIDHEHNRKHELVMRFFDALRVHYKREHRVRFYADLLYVSADHLSKIVKQITHKTAQGLVQEFLLREAKALLLERKSIVTISQNLGFNSKHHFSNFFKKHTSLSPSAYRKNLSPQNPK